MARRCEICDRGTVSGHNISHAHNLTNRTWKPNLQRVRAVLGGVTRRVWVCTRCLRSGKIQKPPVRTWIPDTEAPGSPS